MKLERHEHIPDLKAHWQQLFRATDGLIQHKVGYIAPHQVERFETVISWVNEFGPFKRGIEVGCCEGVMTLRLAPNFEHLLAIDFIPEFLELCPSLPNVTYAEHDITTWTPDDVDLIVMGEVLEHIPDPIEVLKRFRPHTEFLIASCPVNEELTDTTWHELSLPMGYLGVGETAGHVWAMDLDGFLSMFASAGYVVVRQWSDGISAVVLARTNNGH